MLSFVIVVKGGEGLGVSINANGGDCWKYGLQFSLMSKQFMNGKGHDGRVISVKDKGKTKGEPSISQRKYKGSDDMA